MSPPATLAISIAREPAGQGIEAMGYALPGETVTWPRLLATAGRLLYEVDWLTPGDSCEKSRAPEPDMVYDEVSRVLCSGNRNVTWHVWPAADAGMSKLKTLETVAVTVP